MAAYEVIFVDPGGEYYFSSGVTAAGVWTGGATGSLTNAAPAGRSTTYAYAMGGANAIRNFASYQSWIIGGAVNPSNFNAAGAVIFQLLDNATIQVDCRVTASGAITITRNGTVLGTSTNTLTPNVWSFIEFKPLIASGTGGSAEVKVNGVSWVSVSSVNTQTSANASANQLKIIGFNASGNCYWKDMYVMVDTGTGPFTTYLGDITVAVIYPNSAGPAQSWTLGAGSTQTVAVQDGINHTGTWPDGDTTYISSSTAGQISDFVPQSLSLTGTIYSVVHATYARKDDAGPRTIAQYCNSSSSVETSSNISLGNVYQYYYDVIDKDPNTSAAWTPTGFNAAYFGVKLVS